MKRTLLCLTLLLLAGAVQAHKASDSYLSLGARDGRIGGHWDIALRDLELAVGLDADRDGRITRGELRAGEVAIAAHAAARLELATVSGPCALTIGPVTVAQHSDGAYARSALSADCPPDQPVRLRYALLFDLDPTHRGLLRLDGDGEAQSWVLSPENPVAELGRPAPTVARVLARYLREGVHHIWIGSDHVLFLLTLLLPAVLLRRGRGWVGGQQARVALVDTVKIVTAFTLAHSVTLSLAVLEWVSLPARWVESAIAASVLVTALNNLWPVFAARWRLAFAFGLVHGFGFANVLTDLGLSAGSLAASLAGFNLGVELGQLAILAAFFPLAWWWRNSAAYRVALLRGGSALAAVAALGWLAERLLNYDLPVL